MGYISIYQIYMLYRDNRSKIRLEEDKNKAKFISAKEYCKKNNIEFNVWTEKEGSSFWSFKNLVGI